MKQQKEKKVAFRNKFGDIICEITNQLLKL